jgi:D-glycero-alpha-D-manno-heptose-7-phosphate kinase
VIIVRSPVRISFSGGGTDLPSYYEKQGGLVLSTAIDKYFYTVLTDRDDSRTQIISSDLRALETCEDIEKMELHGTDLEIPFAVLKYFRSAVGVNLFLASEVPPGTGLGSSAAVCVSVLKAFSTRIGREMSKQDLAEAAFDIARNILKRPVGKQDEYAAAHGGLNIFKFDADGVEVEPVRLSPEMLTDLQQSLLLFFTGSSRDSSGILAAQDESVQQRDDSVLDALSALKQLVFPMRDALLRGDLDAFASLLDTSWNLKRRVSTRISNPLIDQIYEAARRQGALGGKITGAGGGGFLLLFCPRDRQQFVRAALREFGLKEMRFHFDLAGTRVVYDDPFFDAGSGGGIQWIFRPTMEPIAS